MRSIRFAVLMISPWLCRGQERDSQAIPALLSEVRALRLAIERSTLLGTRMQITLQRIQLQEQRTARVSQELERARREAADAQNANANITSRLKHDEDEQSATTDPVRRKQLEDVVKRMKVEAELMTTREQQSRAREAEIATQVRNEQSRLIELNDSVNQMERAHDEALRQLGQR
jgi:hypothetical protein